MLRTRSSSGVSVGTVGLLQGMQTALHLLLGCRFADAEDAADLPGGQSRREAELDRVPLSPRQIVDEGPEHHGVVGWVDGGLGGVARHLGAPSTLLAQRV